ncbi:non-specific lipid transfer protein GPI-anchored 3 isoform X2 [Pyrus x bretschneideri]|uniref:non-specific lipid transfer protein GPI-anchored 3 isoform X2 n=1 Tax=Pyrus x bretschneideri TaxID=225117 RepID=UPI000510B615|nr:non-specific lipid transfer protein GPI-anchored 3 isoform X2 [Pyrus x bretschneideri]
MASISKHLLPFLFLSLFELFGVSHGRKLTALPDKEGAAGGGSDSSMQCVQKLIPCQAYLKAPEKAPSTCCLPLKKLVLDNTECLCTLFNNDDMLSNFNITQGDALKLSKACDANADISVCKKDAASPVSTASPSNNSNSPGSSKSAAYALSPLAGSGFAVVFMALIIAAF